MHRKTFYMVSVAAVVLALALSIALPVEAATSAKDIPEPEVAGGAPGGEVPDLPGAETHAGVCVLCYTCGGSWPRVRGYLYPPSGLATWELGSRCGGYITYRHDPRPNYCCTR